jgi:aarF domain-containing kinase
MVVGRLASHVLGPSLMLVSGYVVPTTNSRLLVRLLWKQRRLVPKSSSKTSEHLIKNYLDAIRSFRRSRKQRSLEPTRVPSKSSFPTWIKLAGILVMTSGMVYVASHVSENVSIFTSSLIRSIRSTLVGMTVILQYKWYFWRYDMNAQENSTRRSQLNLRSAQMLLWVFKKNGGIYTKAGQHLASLTHALPKEYTETMSVLQDAAPYLPYNEIVPLFIEEFGKTPADLFREFERHPIASASLAQVHRAHTWAGDDVAVKVQYPFVGRLLNGDLSTLKMLCSISNYLFEGLNLDWIVEEFENNLVNELNFINEAQNCEETEQLFVHKKRFRVPKIFWEYTTPRILTMELIRGFKITDMAQFEKTRIDQSAVFRVLSEVFAEMLFLHGRIHADPHPGNIMVEPASPTSKTTSLSPSQHTDFTVVLLDHGLYKTVSENFRFSFAQLWKALIFHDEPLLKESSERLGTGSYSKLFPVIFTARLWNSQTELGDKMLEADRQKIQNRLKQVNVSQIVGFLEKLPRDMLMVIKMNTLVASIGRHLGAPSLMHYRIMAAYAIRGISRSSHANASEVSFLPGQQTLRSRICCQIDLVFLNFTFWWIKHFSWLFRWLTRIQTAYIRWRIAFSFAMHRHSALRATLLTKQIVSRLSLFPFSLLYNG